MATASHLNSDELRGIADLIDELDQRNRTLHCTVVVKDVAHQALGTIKATDRTDYAPSHGFYPAR
ncbi:MAG TPA: hypothetical protein VID94_08355 [Acidimicrobiales bacterium]|jgi:hypothetical protein